MCGQTGILPSFLNNMPKRLCTVLARGGSRGFKNKNIRMLLGKPLIAHSIEQARESGLFEVVAVSSDSKEILQIGKKWGADYVVRRPAELASDEAPKVPAIQHCVEEVERLSGKRYDVVVDLDSTAPLRTLEDIRGTIQLLEERGVSNVFTVSPARRNPYFNMVELNENGVPHLSKPMHNQALRRQDAPNVYSLNAAVYAWQRDRLFESNWIYFKDTLVYVMPPERIFDIDSEVDFKIVRLLLKEQQLKMTRPEKAETKI